MPLFHIRGENVVPMTDFSLEEEDEEVEKIEGCNHREWKNPLLPILCRLVPENCEHEAKRVSVFEPLWKRAFAPEREVCNEDRI